MTQSLACAEFNEKSVPVRDESRLNAERRNNECITMDRDNIGYTEQNIRSPQSTQSLLLKIKLVLSKALKSR